MTAPIRATQGFPVVSIHSTCRECSISNEVIENRKCLFLSWINALFSLVSMDIYFKMSMLLTAILSTQQHFNFFSLFPFYTKLWALNAETKKDLMFPCFCLIHMRYLKTNIMTYIMLWLCFSIKCLFKS